jgi:hypothetical protein
MGKHPKGKLERTATVEDQTRSCRQNQGYRKVLSVLRLFTVNYHTTKRGKGIMDSRDRLGHKQEHVNRPLLHWQKGLNVPGNHRDPPRPMRFVHLVCVCLTLHPLLDDLPHLSRTRRTRP